MKKLFLTIAVIAFVIILIAAILALLSVFNLVPFFSKLVMSEQSGIPDDQVTILFASVDSLEENQFNVKETWIVYMVTSRMDTAIIKESNLTQTFSKRLRRSMTESGLIRLIEAEEGLNIDYVFLIDEIGQALINELLENQQSSINLNNSGLFCEILVANELHLFDLYLNSAGAHARSTIPQDLTRQFAKQSDLYQDLYCESIEP